MQVGDLIGSGTISGTDPGSVGSFLEASAGGNQTIELSSGVKRTFLEDGDSITIRGWCGEKSTGLVGFGDCEGRIISARKV